MKKVFLGVAVLAMVGLAACSNKDKAESDTASIDTVNVEVAEDTNVTVDSLNDSTALVTETVTETVAAEAAPAN